MPVIREGVILFTFFRSIILRRCLGELIETPETDDDRGGTDENGQIPSDRRGARRATLNWPELAGYQDDHSQDKNPDRTDQEANPISEHVLL